MDFNLYRFSDNGESTLSLFMTSNKEFLCYMLEDEYRLDKIKGETRVPSGRYKLRLRTQGGFHDRYKKRFPEIHEGMIELADVPGFKYILIHCGNTDDDTAGCLLTGDTANNNTVKTGFVGESTNSYRRIYPILAEAIQTGDAFINIYEEQEWK